jgi:ankyrin repeat protein
MRKESRALRDLKNAIKSLCGKIYEGSIASDSLALNARLEIGKALLCTTTPYILDWPLSDEGFDDLQNLIRKSVAAGQLHHTVQLQATLLSNCHLPDEPLDSLITEEAFRAELLAYQVTHETLFRDFSGELIHGKTLPHLFDMSIDLAIRCGVFLDSKDILDRPLLHLALVCKREDVDIDRLINISTSIDSQDFIGMRPIHLACWHGNVAAVQALIGRGASLTSKVGAAEWLPWHFAALSGDSRLVETLMDTLGSNGLGINCQTRRKETALRIAVCRRHESVVEMLLARGADPTIPDDSDRNCLHMAVQSGSCYLVQLLLWGTYGPTLNVQLGWSRYTPLHWIIVIEGGKNVGIIIKILLHHDSTNANAEDNYGNTPLQLAVKYQHLEAVKALLTSNKVLTNRKDSAGRTPLFIAAGQGYDRIVEVLLRSGRVTANISDNYGWTPLSISIEKGHTKAAQLIQRFLYRSQGMPLAPGTCWP